MRLRQGLLRSGCLRTGLRMRQRLLRTSLRLREELLQEVLLQKEVLLARRSVRLQQGLP